MANAAAAGQRLRCTPHQWWGNGSAPLLMKGDSAPPHYQQVRRPQASSRFPALLCCLHEGEAAFSASQGEARGPPSCRPTWRAPCGTDPPSFFFSCESFSSKMPDTQPVAVRLPILIQLVDFGAPLLAILKGCS
jgi:hypothetical protein